MCKKENESRTKERQEIKMVKLGIGSIGSILNRYGSLAGVAAAAYNVYGTIGFDGLIADVSAVTKGGFMGKWKEMAMGGLAIVAAPIIAARVPNTMLKGVVKFGLHYYGTTQILSAFRGGAGHGYGRARGYVPAGMYAGMRQRV